MSISITPTMGEPPTPELGSLEADRTPRAQSPWRLFVRRFLRHRVAVLALFVLAAVYGLALFAEQVAPHPLNPVLAETLASFNEPPNGRHWFGTDELGRDVLTRLLFAARVSLSVGLLVALVSTVVGVAVGSVSGFMGGVVDSILMRVTDLFLIVPGIAVLAMIQKGLTGKELWVVGRVSPSTLMIGSLSLLFWMPIARVVRGLCLSVREKEFVEAARASGASGLRIVTRHILPNIIGPIAVNATLAVGLAIISESTLSFLGFGLQPPDVSWGTMLSQSRSAVGTPRAYLIYFPGLALLLTVLCVNFVGDGLRDALDPRSGK